MNIKGSRDTRAKEQVLNRLLDCIKEAFVEEMAKDDLGDAFLIVAPPSRSSLPPKKTKRRRVGVPGHEPLARHVLIFVKSVTIRVVSGCLVCFESSM